MGVLELACPTACACLFKVRPGVLSQTLSHMWDKLNLPILIYVIPGLTLKRHAQAYITYINVGKFNLPHIWDRVLHNTPGLTLKRHAQTVGHTTSNTPI